MIYMKTTNNDGFVFASTINAETGGNSTKAEHDVIVGMYENAADGYGVKEEGGEFVYAAYHANDNIDDSEALEILLGGAE